MYQPVRQGSREKRPRSLLPCAHAWVYDSEFLVLVLVCGVRTIKSLGVFRCIVLR